MILSSDSRAPLALRAPEVRVVRWTIVKTKNGKRSAQLPLVSVWNKNIQQLLGAQTC